MKRLFGNWGVLAAAWLIVVAGLAATVGLALLQAPPPASGDPVAVTLEAPEAPEAPGAPGAPESPEAAEGVEEHAGMAPDGAEPGAVTAPLPDAAPEDGAHAEGPSEGQEMAGEMAGEMATDGHGNEAPLAEDHAAPEGESHAPAEAHAESQADTQTEADAHAEGAPPAEDHAGEDQGADHAAETAEMPAAGHGAEAQEHKDPEHQDPEHQDPEHQDPEHQDPEHQAEEHPAEAAPAPEHADEGHAAEGHTADGNTAEGHGTEGHGASPTEQQTAVIPVIPPSPEQLPYWQRYSQPFNIDDKRPRIAVVMTGLGLSDSATEAAINKLPPAVTLSFSPYARDLERWIALARARGHEVMLDLPMEPATFPNEDPGPQGLLTSLSPEDNVDRLDWVLSRGSAYVGLAGAMGSRFTAARDAIEPVLREVKNRGLMFLDRRTTERSLVSEVAADLDLPSAINNRSIDERQASRVAIDARLAQIERIALTDGYAVAMAQPYPVTLDRLAEWATEISSRGLVLAPISALADLQKVP